MTLLSKLSLWLNNQGLTREAQAVKELPEPETYEEPWHEEAVQEFGSEPLSEEDSEVEAFNFREKPFITSPEEIENQEEDLHIDAETIKKVTDREGFKVLSVGERSPLLGMGGYGTVLGGTYQGKPAAAKVIFPHAASNTLGDEGDNWRKILKASETFPADLKVHIPTIYRINKDVLPDSGGLPLPYEIIIMEELKPLDQLFAKLFREREFKEQASYLLKDEEYLYKIAQRILNVILDIAEDYQLPFADLTAPDILKVILEVGTLNSESAPKITNSLLRYLKQRYSLVGEMNYKKNKPGKFEDSELFNLLYDKVRDSIQRMINPKKEKIKNKDNKDELKFKFPMFGWQDTAFWEDTPETSGLYQTLRKLNDEYGIEWGDLHHGNMMLDNDGNLKFIDVGLFDTIGSKVKLPTEPTKTLPKKW